MAKCSLCGKECYRYKIKYDGDNTTCYHDEEFYHVAKDARFNGKFMQDQREKYAKDLLQPYNHDGSLNKDFAKTYPDSPFVKDYE